MNRSIRTVVIASSIGAGLLLATPAFASAATKTTVAAPPIASTPAKSAVMTASAAAKAPASPLATVKAAVTKAAAPVAATPTPVGAKLNINSATKKQLIAVKGIGPKMAKEILEYRPYTDFTKLEQKLTKYFPLKTIQNVEPLLSVG